MIAGLVGKLGFYVANQGTDLSAQGTSFYPTKAPHMAPAFSSSTNRSFLMGVASCSVKDCSADLHVNVSQIVYSLLDGQIIFDECR